MAMKIRTFGAVLCVAFLTVVASAHVQSRPAWVPAVDAVFADVAKQGSPGCALAVFRDGRIAYERGYGMADLERDVPITPASVFYVGSLSKQFTAFAVALAASEGKLSLDDDVRKWIPELPDYASRLTVRHLVHHTSGLRDYNTLFDIAGRRNDEAFDNRTVLGIIARQRALNFKPGEEYLYSNSGYVLLSLVVERASGTPLAAFAKTRIFQPLGMGDTQFYDDVTRIVKNRAFAFDRSASGEWRDNTPHSQRTGAGGVLTTVRDLLAWDSNMYQPKVGTSALISEAHQTGSLNSGKALTYAYGLQIGQYRGQRLVEHGGSLGGYRAHLMRFPDERTSVACLCNFGTSNPGTRARRVADEVLRDRFQQPFDSLAPAQGRPVPASTAANLTGGRANAAAVKLTADQLREYVGRYDSDEVDTTFVFDLEGGDLRLKRDRDASPIVLRALASDRFAFRSMVIRFLRDNGRIMGLVVDAGRVVDIRFTRRRTS
jgi:CubicO group peptidase (beta-lactamase class C family)